VGVDRGLLRGLFIAALPAPPDVSWADRTVRFVVVVVVGDTVDL